jgi:hypothetical protein
MGVENILKVGGLEQLVSHKAGVENCELIRNVSFPS